MKNQSEPLDPKLAGGAIILVDHGSRREQSNRLMLEAVSAYRQFSDWSIVEPAHMELAEPSMATAFGRCVRQGADWVIVFPYFLGSGRHSTEDIPRLAVEAAARYPGLRYRVASPLGLHPLLLQVIDARIADCLQSLLPPVGD